MDNALKAISAFRAFGGTAYWVAPDLTARAYGASEGIADPLTARLAGAREAALAVGPWLSEDGERRSWLQLGLACDVADAVATILGRRRGDISALTTALSFATFAVSAALTLAALRSERSGLP